MTDIVRAAAAVFFLLAAAGAAQAAQPAYRIFGVDGQALSADALAGLVNKYDVVIFGEYHDNTLLHALELDLLRGAFKEKPRIALSLEMFERDVQETLDGYLRSTLTEKDFLEGSRPWKNYQEDYRPLVEFAKDNALSVLAANIPRHIASHYAKNGTLDGISSKDAAFLPKVHLTPKGEYWRKFEAVMKENIGDAMPVAPDKIFNYYQAQCLKDDTMAESIAQYATAHRGIPIIHFQGNFHSLGRLGMTEKLEQLSPGLKIAVITPIYVETFADMENLLLQHKNDGDVLILVERPKP